MANRLGQFHDGNFELSVWIQQIRDEAAAKGLDEWTTRWLVAAETMIGVFQTVKGMIFEGEVVMGPPAGKQNDPMDPLDYDVYPAGQPPAKGTGFKPC